MSSHTIKQIQTCSLSASGWCWCNDLRAGETLTESLLHGQHDACTTDLYFGQSSMKCSTLKRDMTVLVYMGVLVDVVAVHLHSENFALACTF